MAVTADAFFAAEDWPRRIWEAAGALTQFLDQNPNLTHASLIESHAGGPDAVHRFEGLMAGFTLFLLEGYRYQPKRQGTPPSAIALEAVAAANFEILYRQARERTATKMSGLLPDLAYMCLAPFVGPVNASELIDRLIGNGSPSA
jgi:hypothetical protein